MINIILWLSVKTTIFSGITAIAFAFTCSLINIRKQSVALKCLCFFLGATLLTELVAAYFNIVYRNNLAVYQIMGPVIMLGSSLYFNYSIPGLKKYFIGYLTALFGFTFTAVNIFMYGGMHKLNAHFAELECLINVGYCMYYFYKLTRTDDIRYIRRNPYFLDSVIIPGLLPGFLFILGAHQYAQAYRPHCCQDGVFYRIYFEYGILYRAWYCLPDAHPPEKACA